MKIIYSSGRKNQPKAIKVDDEDYEMLSQYKWHLSGKYAIALINKQRVLMHRLIMDCPKDKIVDHINHDELDNQKANLRICDRFVNMQNRRKGRGSVKTLRLNGGKYVYYYGELRKNLKRYITTTCPTKEEAAGALKQMIVDKNL